MNVWVINKKWTRKWVCEISNQKITCDSNAKRRPYKDFSGEGFPFLQNSGCGSSSILPDHDFSIRRRVGRGRDVSWRKVRLRACTSESWLWKDFLYLKCWTNKKPNHIWKTLDADGEEIFVTSLLDYSFAFAFYQLKKISVEWFMWASLQV
jgi:hypothetical protein